MPPLVEPVEGPELDRVITALLNLTGVVHRVVDEAMHAGPLGPLGVEAINRAAERLREMLVLFEEHHSDEQLATITDFMALATMLIAERGGWERAFYPDAYPEGEMPLN